MSLSTVPFFPGLYHLHCRRPYIASSFLGSACLFLSLQFWPLTVTILQAKQLFHCASLTMILSVLPRRDIWGTSCCEVHRSDVIKPPFNSPRASPASFSTMSENTMLVSHKPPYSSSPNSLFTLYASFPPFSYSKLPFHFPRCLLGCCPLSTSHPGLTIFTASPAVLLLPGQPWVSCLHWTAWSSRK